MERGSHEGTITCEDAAVAAAGTQVAAPGKIAVLCGLTSQPSLNSKECQLVTFDTDIGLWIVLVTSGEIIFVKPAHLNFITRNRTKLNHACRLNERQFATPVHKLVR